MISTANEFGNRLYEAAETREDFLVCCPDTRSCGLEYFKDRFPTRGFNFGIAEQNLLDVAAGIASTGTKAYVATFAVFMTMRACEQIRQFICYPCQDVTLLSTHTGLQVGLDGGTHIAIEDVGIMRTLPNMTILQPADIYAAREMVKFSLDFHKPLYIRLHRAAVEPVYDASYRFAFNKIRTLRDFGSDVTILSTGVMVGTALKAAELLAEKGIGATVADVSTIKPMDTETLVALAGKTGRVVTLEDHNIIGGLGSAVAEELSRHCPTRMLMLGVPDVYGESGKPEELYTLHKLHPAGVADSVLAFLKDSKE